MWFGVIECTVWEWWAGARLNVHEACLVGASSCAGGWKFCCLFFLQLRGHCHWGRVGRERWGQRPGAQSG